MNIRPLSLPVHRLPEAVLLAAIVAVGVHGALGSVRDLRLMALEQNLFRPILKELADLLKF